MSNLAKNKMHSLEHIANKSLALFLHKANKTEEKALEATDQLKKNRLLVWHQAPELLSTTALWRQSHELFELLPKIKNEITALNAQLNQRLSGDGNPEDGDTLELADEMLVAMMAHSRRKREYDELARRGFAWNEKMQDDKQGRCRSGKRKYTEMS